MTPKEKAESLVDKYTEVIYPIINIEKSKQCALIAVDEILKSHNNMYGVNNKKVKFYLEVKQEIEAL